MDSGQAWRRCVALNLDHLRAFLVVVEEGSINRAAARLLRAQPAVGRQIRLLEESLGTPLLERSSSGVQPTNAGEQLIAHARRIFRNVAEAEAAMARVATEPAGDLIVAIPTSLADQLGPVLFGAMRDRHPRVRLTLLEGDSHAITRWMAGNEADIGVLPEGSSDTSLHAIECGRQVFCFCGPADGFPVLPASMPLGDALSYPLALSIPPNRLRRLVDSAAAGIGREVRPVLNASSSHLITALMRQGELYTIRPRIGPVPAVVDGIAFIPIAEPAIQRGISVVWSTARPLSPAGEAARATLEELLRGMDGAQAPG